MNRFFWWELLDYLWRSSLNFFECRSFILIVCGNFQVLPQLSFWHHPILPLCTINPGLVILAAFWASLRLFINNSHFAIWCYQLSFKEILANNIVRAGLSTTRFTNHTDMCLVLFCLFLFKLDFYSLKIGLALLQIFLQILDF